MNSVGAVACAFKIGRCRSLCGGAPEVEPTALGNGYFCRCARCGGATAITKQEYGEEGAIREWNRWMRLEGQQTERRL